MTAPAPDVARAGLASPRSVPFVAAALVVCGFVAIGLSWRGAAALLDVPLQVPYAVSGGAGGLALVVFGMGIAYVHTSRVAVATELAAIDDLHLQLAAATLQAVTRAKSDARATRRAQRAARRAERRARRS